MSDKIREAFEKFHAEHLRKIGMDESDIATECDRLENGDYQWSMAADAWPYWQTAAAIAIAQQPATVAVPDGWKLVPVEPARAMWAAAGDAVTSLQHAGIGHHDKVIAAVYKAMLTAAPAAAVAVRQEPVASCCPYCGKSPGQCDPSFPHPLAADQPDTVKVMRHTLARYAGYLQNAGYNNAADELRSILLAGGDKP